FMAVWLAVVVLLHPLVTMTLLGPAIAAVVPLLYFGALALATSGESNERGSLWGSILHLVTVAVVWWAGEHLVSARVSPVEPVVSTIGHYYRSATDKVVMLIITEGAGHPVHPADPRRHAMPPPPRYDGAGHAGGIRRHYH